MNAALMVSLENHFQVLFSDINSNTGDIKNQDSTTQFCITK